MNTRNVDLAGQQFGLLTVVGYGSPQVNKKGHKIARLECICECGKRALFLRKNVLSRRSSSCGCRKITQPKLIVSGTRFGRLTTTGSRGADSYGELMWECRCECGNIKVVRGSDLRRERTPVRSCGCLHTKPTGVVSMHDLFLRYRRGARVRGWTFDLTEQQTLVLLSDVCYYCGATPNRVHVKRNGVSSCLYNGIDRVDNALGYTVANTVTACWICNRAKADMSLQQFLDWAIRVCNSATRG